ncbi:hypothetical protein BJX66DRAFT_149925 [Aspergillus keveii]|uniref:Indole-diterpene biosynthesis protein PaxU n=1 Tax=Aspergillus keveii TaxID=714993 RepID=A0ABR4GN72_9EURO
MSTSSPPTIPLTKLSPQIFLSDPPDFKPSNKLIILSLFMNAPLRISQKYIAHYRRLAPHTQILVLTSSTSDIILPPNQKGRCQELAPALEVLSASLAAQASTSKATGDSKELSIHIHLFSNGGVYSTTSLLQSYRSATGHALPITSIILDSAPGIPGFVGGMRSFSAMLPRNIIFRSLGQISFLAILSFLWVISCLGFVDSVTAGRRAMNEKGLIGGQPKRVYIYSNEDKMVDWEDVEEHAKEAEENGWEVQMERFEGSGHVDHMRRDEGRYWGIVEGCLGLRA